jgi:hypothetical protein
LGNENAVSIHLPCFRESGRSFPTDQTIVSYLDVRPTPCWTLEIVLGLVLVALALVTPTLVSSQSNSTCCVPGGDSQFERSSSATSPKKVDELCLDWPLDTEEHSFFVQVPKSSQG